MPKQIVIPGIELFDEVREEFITTSTTTITIEHSLVSLSKWESKWEKPFLGKDPMTAEQTIDYIRCMTLTQNVDPEVYNHITNDIIDEVSRYISKPMTATWFSEKENKKAGMNGEIITSELIYYWMIALNIPFKCERWHLNRLITLIKVCNIKNAPPKKMSKHEILNRNRSLNEARKAALGTNG